MIELRMLGSIDLHDGRGRPIRSVLGQPKRLALLAYLASQPFRFCSRDTLISLFWPELDTGHARASLRQTLYYLRSSLGEGALSGAASTVEVDPHQLWSDAHEFQSALAVGMLERALSLYRGDLLPGLFLSAAPAFERWLEEERVRLRRLAARAAWALSDRELGAENEVAAANWGGRSIEILPEDEAATRRLMERLDHLGDRCGAVEVYQHLTRRLSTDYELEPAPETKALAESIRRRRTVGARNGSHAQPEKRLAVLPFDGDRVGNLAEGLTEQITNDLSAMRGLSLVCQASSAVAKAQTKDAEGAASKLNAGYVLVGSVRRAGPDLELTARLLAGGGRSIVWTEQHSGAAAQLPEVRQALVARIARTLRLSPGSHTTREGSRIEEVRLLEANGQARRELCQWTPEAFDRAILLATDALDNIGHDECLLATLGQGHLPHVILGSRAGVAHLAHAERAAARMMTRNPESARAYVLRGLVRLRRGNSQGCAQDLQTALQLNPSNPEALFWLSLVYVISGRGKQARPVADRLLTVDPMNSTSRCLPGYIEAHSGSFADAHPHYQIMYRMEPESPVNRWCYSQLLLRAGRTTEACSMMEGVIACAPDAAIGRQARVFLPALRGDRTGMVRGMTGELRKEARRDEHGSWWLASALSIAGETDEALLWLSNAVRLGYIDEPFLARIDPCLERLRGTRGFKRIMGRAKKAYDNFDVPASLTPLL